MTELPNWQMNWNLLLETARAHADERLDKTTLCDAAGVDGGNDYSYALKQARNKLPGEYAEFQELTGRKGRDKFDDHADDDNEETIEASEEITESDALQNIIVNLEAIPAKSRAKVLNCAMVFLDIELSPKPLKAAAPVAKRKYKKRRGGRKAARA